MKTRYDYTTLRVLCLLLITLCFSDCKRTKEPDPISVPVIEGTTEVRFEDYEKMILSSSVSKNGGSPIINYGHLYSLTDPNPTKGNTPGVAVAGIPNATYTNTVTNYSLNKTMYVRAFADNAAGTGYGKVVQVKTPSVTYSMKFTCLTGADDKGTSSAINAIGARVQYDDGDKVDHALITSALSPRSTSNTTITLSKANIRRVQIEGVYLSYWGIRISPFPFESYDNWDLDGLKVELLDNTGKSWVIYDKLNAGRLFRFTEQQNKTYFPFN